MDDQNKEVALISAAARHLVAKHANTLEDQKLVLVGRETQAT
jgi:hypothetical protein